MAINKIEDTDLIPAAFGKTNDAMDELIVAGQMAGNGVLSLERFNATTIDIPFPYFEDKIVEGLEFEKDPASPSGLAWIMSPGIYQVNAVVVTIDEDVALSLSTPDPTRERIDAVVGDDEGAVVTRAGTWDAEGNPVAPVAAAGEVVLELFSVDPASTGVDNSEIYAEPPSLAWNPRGEYDPAETYNKNDLVTQNGSSFASLQNNLSGEAPIGEDGSPSAAWQLIAEKGDAGAPGDDGAPGVGVPVGGTAGQVLTKIDGTDYNTEWTTPSGGAGWTPPKVSLFGDFAAPSVGGASKLTDGVSPGLIWGFDGDVGQTAIQGTIDLGKDYDGSGVELRLLCSLNDTPIASYDTAFFTFTYRILENDLDTGDAPTSFTETIDLSSWEGPLIVDLTIPTALSGLGYASGFACLHLKIERDAENAADDFGDSFYIHALRLVKA